MRLLIGQGGEQTPVYAGQILCGMKVLAKLWQQRLAILDELCVYLHC